MNRYLAILIFTIAVLSLSDVRAQHSLQLDPGNGNYITISAPPGLNPGYNWVLPLNPPPSNTAFTQGGSLEGQVLRWNNTLGYYVPSSALLILSSGAMTLDPGEGNNITLTNIPTDNSADLFMTVNGFNQVRMRTLGSILGVTANEGLVYDEPNIKLGAGDANTNPFLSDRYVNVTDNLLTFTSGGQSTDHLVLDGSNGTTGVGLSPTGTFKLEVAGDVGPATNNTYALGSADMRWKDLYLGSASLYIGVGAADQSKLGYDNFDETAQMLTIDANDDADIDATVDESGRLAVKDGIESMGNTDLKFRTNGEVRARFINDPENTTTGAFVPELTNTYDLGTPNLRWREIYVSEGSIKIGGFINGAKGSQNPQAVDEVTLSYSDGNLVIDKPVANFGSMVPNTNNILELGSSSNRWKDIWLGPNSIHIGSPSYEGSISYDPTAKELKFNSNNTIGSTEMKIDDLGNLVISSLAAGGLLKANTGGMLAIATGGTDFESPLTFSNGLTRTVNNVTLGGTLTGGTDINIGGYNLTFTRTTGKVSIGAGASPAELLSVGAASAFQVNNAGQIAAATGITSSGTVTFSGLPTGIVHSTAGVLSSSAVNLAGGATELSGQLGVANGGTGRSSVTAQALLIGNGTSAMNELGVGGANTILGVSAGAPAWVTLSTDATLVGDGRGTAFGLKLNNANTWSALQTFSNGASISGGLTIPAGANSMSVNGSTGTANDILTSQGSNSPQWKSLSTLGVPTGSGTLNSIAMWSSSSALGNAPMTVTSGNVSFTGTIASATGITSSGSIAFSSLNAGGIVKATVTTGVLALATAGTDYQTPLTISNGLTNTSGAVKLGGALTGATDVALSTFNLAFSGSSGNVYVGQTSGAARLDVLSSTSTTALKAVASGSSAGKAADFSNDNSSNTNDVLTATNAGSGWTGKFDGSGTSSKGVYINAGQDTKGLQLNRGSLILSHTTDAAGNNINPNADANAVHAVNDDGNAGGSTFKLPVGTNGQILYIFNGDTNGNLTIQQNLHASNTGPVAVLPGNTVICIYVTNATGSGWVTK